MHEIHPIDMLVDLVISEEIDPWDIDIEDIANRFLQKLKQMQKINLYLSGKTVLTASILLRMKSERITQSEKEEIEEAPVFYFEDEKPDIPAISVPLRRIPRRKITLFELVEALQMALNEELIRKNFPKGQKNMVIKIQEDGIEEKMAKVYEKIRELAEVMDVIRFSDLISGKKDAVGIFLVLLHLDSQKKINIWQKELFGDIFIALN